MTDKIEKIFKLKHNGKMVEIKMDADQLEWESDNNETPTRLYQLRARIGSGTFGNVYVGKSRQITNDVAVWPALD